MFIASGSNDNSIRVWSVAKRTQEWMVIGHNNYISSLSFSPNGAYLASGSGDYTVKVWRFNSDAHPQQSSELFSGKPLCDFKGHTDCVNAVCFTPDSSSVVSASNDKTIRTWNIDKELKDPETIEEFSLTGHIDRVLSVAISHNEQYFVSASVDTTMKVWNVQKKTCEFTFAAHAEYAITVAIDPTDSIIASGGGDSIVKIWGFKEQRQLYGLYGHSSEVDSLVFTPIGNYLISSGEEVIVWDIRYRQESYRIRHTSAVLGLAISSDGNTLAGGTMDKLIKVWKMKRVDVEEEHELKSKTIGLDSLLELGQKFFMQEILKNLSVNPLERSQEVKKKTVSESVYFTPKGSFAVVFLGGVVGMVHKLEDKLYIEVNEDKWGPTHMYDPFYEDPGVFYNVIDALKMDRYSELSSAAGRVTIGRCRYTITHVLCALGKFADLDKWLSRSTCVLKCDIFGKSAFFYAIKNNSQNCIDSLIKSLNQTFENPENENLKISLYAIRNDFIDIIINSSRYLDVFLKNLMITSEVSFAKMKKHLPAFHLYDIPIPLLQDFLTKNRNTKNLEEVPFVLSTSAFPFVNSTETRHNYKFTYALLQCKNNQIYSTPIIQYLIQLQWARYSPLIIFFAFTFLANITLFLLLLNDGFTDLSVLILFIIVNAVLICWELIQMKITGIKYFLDPWNIIDVIRMVFTVSWIISECANSGSIYVTWVMAFFNLIRGLGAFRILDGSRYYVRLMINSLFHIRYFIMVYFYTTFTFGVLFVISRTITVNFENIWVDPYALNFGSFTSPDPSADFTLDYMVYILATITNVVLMLNLIVSQLGEVYNQYQLDKYIIDYKERAEQIFEIQGALLFFTKTEKRSDMLYLSLCVPPEAEVQADEVQQKIVELEEKVSQNKDDLKKAIESVQAKVDSLAEKMDFIIEKLIK